ncbi:erythroblast NAD(P)(+)--arginine ADP-ribosyltransferase-like, partial [Eucyclogobius newberryi]|uniref:erythroblast NAD(P)(+)--arginine ADP-ribosyltransferase-like n=1 Tax=Eucyclogobius newberryi TaxID=166745 RepID=UPI003B5C2EEE
SSFQYHALYFWLTSALQVLKNSCETTYKRTCDVYNGKQGTVMRFGYFASTSRSPFVVEYGEETCFHIKTCFGAFIGDYSVAPSEEEVLVPSYEEFRIVDIVAESTKIFVLESVGHSSNLNCNAANRNQEIRVNFALISIFQVLIALLLSNFGNTIN